MLEQQGGMIVLAVEEPVGDTDGGDVALLAEKAERGFVALIDEDVELMEVEDAAGIVVDLVDSGSGIALVAVVVEDDETDLSPTVGGIEVDKVDDADGLAFGVVDHHPHLTVGVDVVGDVGHVVVEHITGIGHVGGADVPEADVVLDAVEQVEVFGLDGAEGYFIKH